MIRIVAEAPHRICDIGGWTDTWFAETGRVVNFAVNPSSKIEIVAEENKKETITFHSEISNSSYTLTPDRLGTGDLRLLEMIVKEIGFPRNHSIEIIISSAIAPGSSAGTSAAVSVALIGGMARLQHLDLDRQQIAILAHKMETEKLHLQSGVQDQYASSFGSISSLTIDPYPNVTRTEISLTVPVLNELQERLYLLSFGRAHSSSEIHTEVIRRMEGKGPQAEELAGLRHAAEHAYESLLKEDISSFGEAMIENTMWQKQLHSSLISPEAEEVIRISKIFQCAGYKVNGAGGNGGSMTILCPADDGKKKSMIHKILSINRQFSFIPITINMTGLTVSSTVL
jgi:D-glycero-alpha-D-manno-heptose-7-phosphate kinase